MVPGDPRALAIVRSVVLALCSQAGLGELRAGKIEVAVDEAVTNIIEHAYSGESPKPSIRLQFSLSPRRIMIDIIDNGRSFDYDGYAPPTFPDHWNQGNTRGVGIYLIRECMDEVQYEQLTGDRNRMRLIKLI